MDEPKKTHETCSDCGGHDCLTVWPNGNTYCHQCPPGQQMKINHVPEVEDDSLDLHTVGYRSIEEDVAEFYGIATTFNEDGKAVSRIYPYPHKDKIRVLPKDFTRNKGFTTDHLFGMDKFNAGSSKVLTIVEGEDDAAAAYQMLGKTFPVVSLPGAKTVRKVLQNPKAYSFIKSHQSIVIATDSDAVGEEAAEALQRSFPGRCYRVNMSKYKDACEYLENNAANDFKYAWINRVKYVPDNIFNTSEQFEKIIKGDQGSMYIPTGISDFDEAALGLMQGHFTLFQAPEGYGKTEIMRMLEANLLKNHPTVPFASMHMEETKKRGLLGLASYMLEKDVTLQDTETVVNSDGDEEIVYLPSYKGTPEEEVLDAIRSFTERENFYQFTLSVDDDPMSILEQIRYFSEVCGCKYVFFEPIQDLGYSRQTDATLESWLSELATKLARLASELGIGIVSIAHENDDGQIRDCRMLGKRASVVVRLDRDKDSTDPNVSNTTTLKLLKNRPVGPTSFAGMLEFDPDSFTLSEKVF